MSIITNKPLVIAVAPNGARYTRKDHPQLPITPAQLAETAVECLAAGATMIHLHVRDPNDRHSLEPKYYRPALEAVKEAVGDEMIIQVTSESAGVYQSEEQRKLLGELMPDCLSVALREIAPLDAPLNEFREFIYNLSANGCLLQYILYDAADYNRYLQLIAQGDIPSAGHSLLFVLGRYTKAPPTVDIVDEFKDILTTDAPWMVCTFGASSHKILSKAVELGCHARIGFENGFYLPNGNIAKSNAELIEMSRQSFEMTGRKIANITEARILLGQDVR
ncbi:MAG: 3-keto-5-aminohexanoate cleavage enzyme [Enterobacterales bacterium]|jgi:3-keto-5-aminohexanoate cleavage enzyme